MVFEFTVYTYDFKGCNPLVFFITDFDLTSVYTYALGC